jgi:hypothetical protein
MLVASQLFIPDYKFYCVQWRGLDLSTYTVTVLRAGAKAKTVTSKLPLLSVLALAVP